MSNQSNGAQGLFFVRATVLAAIVMGIVASLNASAGQDKTGLRIAVVNPGRVLAEYKFAKQSTDTLEKLDSAIFEWLGAYPPPPPPPTPPPPRPTAAGTARLEPGEDRGRNLAELETFLDEHSDKPVVVDWRVEE